MDDFYTFYEQQNQQLNQQNQQQQETQTQTHSQNQLNLLEFGSFVDNYNSNNNSNLLGIENAYNYPHEGLQHQQQMQQQHQYQQDMQMQLLLNQQQMQDLDAIDDSYSPISSTLMGLDNYQNQIQGGTNIMDLYNTNNSNSNSLYAMNMNMNMNLSIPQNHDGALYQQQIHSYPTSTSDSSRKPPLPLPVAATVKSTKPAAIPKKYQQMIHQDTLTSAARTPGLSKHVSNVISHFSSSKDGYSKLLDEIEDFVHVVSGNGTVYFASMSVLKLLGQSQEDVVGTNLFDMIHQNDRETARKYIDESIAKSSEFIMYIRYLCLSGTTKLCEVKGKPYIYNNVHGNSTHKLDDSSSGAQNGEHVAILCAREYCTGGTQAIDSIVGLQIEGLQFERRLEQMLVERGMDVGQHPLLSPDACVDMVAVSNSHDNDFGDDFTDAFLFSVQGDHAQPGAPLIDLRMVGDGKQDTQAVQHPEKEKKVRKRKTVHTDMFCLQCGTTKSPEWRAGPEGPKTLCNACGLAYYKRNKKMALAHGKM